MSDEIYMFDILLSSREGIKLVNVDIETFVFFIFHLLTASLKAALGADF